METKLIQSGLRILDESYHYLEHPETVTQGMDLLFDGLYTKRSENNREFWQHFCENVCHNHPIQSLLHQDPLTLRSFSKPRGYSGDAVLLDFIYRHPAQEDELEKASPIGRAVCEYMVSRPAAESVRWRRELLSQLLDETVKKVQNAEILSVACGHLREAANSMAIKNNLVHRFIAFEQDPASLKIHHGIVTDLERMIDEFIVVGGLIATEASVVYIDRCHCSRNAPFRAAGIFWRLK